MQKACRAPTISMSLSARPNTKSPVVCQASPDKTVARMAQMALCGTAAALLTLVRPCWRFATV